MDLYQAQVLGVRIRLRVGLRLQIGIGLGLELGFFRATLFHPLRVAILY